MNEFFEELKESLEQVCEHEHGKQTLRSHLVETPSKPAQYTASDVKKIRATIGYSQALFARFLNVSVKTVRSWESGERKPSQSALRLLEIIENGIYRPVKRAAA